MSEQSKPGNTHFHFCATGIGSVPFLDIENTCRRILSQLPIIPFWPQFVRRSHVEDMNIQFSEGLPFFEINNEHRTIGLSSCSLESALFIFYEHFLSDDLDAFAMSEAYAPGLYRLIEFMREQPLEFGPYVKGQVVGPVTFASSVKDRDGTSILHNPDLIEAIAKGLAIKALWQARALARTGKRPIIFLDEPALSGFGSGFSTLQRHDVVKLITEIMGYLRDKSDTLIGIHCCGNTDWPMIIETRPDIISFDAYSYLDYFLLYPKEVGQFVRDGGIIAWGIVPTAVFSGKESIEELSLTLQKALHRFYEWDLAPELVSSQSILTPACGMGTLSEKDSESVFDLLAGLSKRCGRFR